MPTSTTVVDSETVPLIAGTLGLPLANLFFCEFDGPRHDRTVVVTVLAGSLRAAGVPAGAQPRGEQGVQ